MADQISGIASGATGTGLGGITGALQGGIGNLTNMGSSFLDKWFPKEKREEVKSKLTKFATEKPMLASFIFSQIALSGLPIVLFIIMSITVFIFALLAGILVGVIGALLFVVFALGVALFVLLPVLFITTFSAVAIWVWGVGAYYLLKWFNEKSVPGIHVPLGEGLSKQTGLGSLLSLTDKPAPVEAPNEPNNSTTKSSTGDKPQKTHKKENAASTTSAQPTTNGTVHPKSEHHADGKENHARERHPKKLETRSSPASASPSPNKSVNDAANAVGGITKGLTG